MLNAHNELVPSPTAQSLEFRSNLTGRVSNLRRIRPRVPFFRLAAHRIPTLWGLYRGLLWTAPTANIQHYIRLWFRQSRHLTGTENTIRDLRKGYKWLASFERAQSGDVKTQAILLRYDRILGVRAEKGHWRRLVLDEVEWQRRLKNRPILTGGLVHPTYYNPPLPRMKPQPMVISRIIAARMKQRLRRFTRIEKLAEMRDMVRREQVMEQALLKETGGKFEPVFEGKNDWNALVAQTAKKIYDDVLATSSRNLRPFPQKLLDQVREARRNKIVNKTKERERERQGEILRITRKRWRKNLTPHLLATLPEKQKQEELIVQRSIAEVGYVGLLKKRKGWGLKDPKPSVEGKKWSVEDAEWIGLHEREAAMKALIAVEEANERKRSINK
ncbi:hypothetical protein D9757_002195 [Collybiopsis confluens]|uniref:Uncharacterized protein n=1 Tax=Collybiopsis confluens TaxID=2823264 RepID=A0A8H5HZT8_9AGAR|nr:hypothetical protein D9757_002195 [Collybiopsis confluens]